MHALKPFNSKKVTLAMRGGFFTKFAALAHCAARGGGGTVTARWRRGLGSEPRDENERLVHGLTGNHS